MLVSRLIAKGEKGKWETLEALPKAIEAFFQKR
jgi:hypothetical protein